MKEKDINIYLYIIQYIIIYKRFKFFVKKILFDKF